MSASTAFNELTVSFCLNMLVRVQFFATFLIATKCPAPFLVFEGSEMKYDDIGLRNDINCWFELKCSHVRNNWRQHVDLCRAMPTTLIFRGLPSMGGFHHIKRYFCSLRRWLWAWAWKSNCCHFNTQSWQLLLYSGLHKTGRYTLHMQCVQKHHDHSHVLITTSNQHVHLLIKRYHATTALWAHHSC